MLGAIAPLAKVLFSTIEKAVPDKDLQEKLKAQPMPLEGLPLII